MSDMNEQVDLMREREYPMLKGMRKSVIFNI